jgi:hypothetical protein
VDPKVKRRGAHDAGLFCVLMMGLSSSDGETVADQARCEALPLIFLTTSDHGQIGRLDMSIVAFAT